MNGTYFYKNVKITVTKGDITKQQVDAIVNPANSQLIMGGGVAGAIKHVGGNEIEIQAMRQAPTFVGNAVVTTAGKLKAKYVIHVPTMEKPAITIQTHNVYLATHGALKCADRLRIRSIAFPGLGTGVGGVSFEESADTMVRALKEHIDSDTALGEIVLVGFSKDLADAFAKAVGRILF